MCESILSHHPLPSLLLQRAPGRLLHGQTLQQDLKPLLGTSSIVRGPKGGDSGKESVQDGSTGASRDCHATLSCPSRPQGAEPYGGGERYGEGRDVEDGERASKRRRSVAVAPGYARKEEEEACEASSASDSFDSLVEASDR